MEKGDEFLTVSEVAERLKLHPNSVRTMIQDGRLPAIRIKRQYRVLPSALDAFAKKATIVG